MRLRPLAVGVCPCACAVRGLGFRALDPGGLWHLVQFGNPSRTSGNYPSVPVGV